ncbi:lymphocyte antigen 75-like [Oppia nitens]|uniref:lymphocyte antigen 75-like n=1 Tax=Oppia nitens TaxID=1686743 RepID=UPI0023DBEF46|nr:lymphocyte antigen 75-like [Oppia nitens]
MNYFILLSIIILIDQSLTINGDCGDWISYHNQKCFKVIPKVGTYQEAFDTCSHYDRSSTLITIHSQTENDFLYNLVKPYAANVGGVWLGTIYKNNVFQWVDHKLIHFSKWAYGNPHASTAHRDCAQMSLINPIAGNWVDEPCSLKALIVCQRYVQQDCPNYKPAITGLHNHLDVTYAKMEANNKKYDAEIKILVNAINEEYQELQKLVKQSVPIGFIYIQLPKQLEPTKLWPNVKWTDISAEYAGLFFRVEGGNSAPFGDIQNANYSRIEYYRTRHFIGLNFKKLIGPINRRTVEGKWLTPKDLPEATYLSNIYTSKGENRPINTAVKIWKCVE